jgi:hypothetical protein
MAQKLAYYRQAQSCPGSYGRMGVAQVMDANALQPGVVA